MDKLKENLFGISVGVTVIVLLALAYFLVWSPLQDLSAAEKKLKSQINKLEKYVGAKKDQVEIEEYVDHLKKKKQTTETDIQGAVQFYEERLKAYKTYFDGSTTIPSLGDFDSILKSRIKELREKYWQVHDIEVDPNAELDQVPPTVSTPPLPEDDQARQIPMAMKEFWISDAVFKAANDLGLGGLKAIDFPERLARDRHPPPYHEIKKVQAQIELPYSKLEDFLTALFKSERVLLELDELTMALKEEPIKENPGLVMTKDYASELEARNADSYEKLVSEPNVDVTLKLNAINFLELVDEPDKKETSKKKKKSGRRRN